MRRPITLFAVCFMAAALSAEAATGRVLKVLPHFLDQNGRHSLSPSLYDRDAYQAHLRQHPEERSGIRFDVQWKARGAISGSRGLKLRVELRGVAKGDRPGELTLEKGVHPGWLSSWSSAQITGQEYRDFGDVTAWRVTLWEGDQLLGEQKSFLW